MEYRREFLALITEDDPLTRSHLQDLLADHFPFIRIIGFAASVREARQLLTVHQIDLLFLDIELPDGKGFDVLTNMNELNFEIIVTTSHSTYALDAIRHSALDYLVKPVTLEELSKAIERFVRKFTYSGTSQLPSRNLPVFQRLPLPTSEGIVFINTDEIIHAEAGGSYTDFILQNGRKIMVSKPLGDFEERLAHRNFFRIHNSHIVNLGQVVKYVRGEGGHVVMTNDTVVPVSRSRKEEFLRLTGC